MSLQGLEPLHFRALVAVVDVNQPMLSGPRAMTANVPSFRLLFGHAAAAVCTR